MAELVTQACTACARSLAGATHYEVRAANGTEMTCFRCALRRPAMLWRSVRVAVLVGTILVLLNQGDRFLEASALSADLWWKVPLTYCVPFCVATYGAMANGSRAPQR